MLLVAGCTGLSSEPRPEIRLDPGETLFFPRVIAGDRYPAPLVVRNVGSAPLTVLDATVLGGSGSPFDLEAPPAFPLHLEPGESHVLQVIYAPRVGASNGVDVDAIEIRSNDPSPARAAWTVTLRSANEGPVISIVPSEVDFSLIQGHEGPVTLTVANSGTEATTVAQLRLEGGAEFELTPVAGLPRPLAVGESFEVQVACRTLSASRLGQTTGIATLRALPADAGHQEGRATLYGPPVANAGQDVDAAPLPLQPVWLDGRGSRSLGNRVTGYQWTLSSSPVGSETALAFNAGEAQTPTYVDAPSCPAGQNHVAEPCFIPDVPGVYRFELRVEDERPLCALGNPGGGACGADEECCSFSCQGTCAGQAGDGLCREGGGCLIAGVNVSTVALRAQGEGLLVYLTWDGTGDFDLHMADDYGGRCSSDGSPCGQDGQCAGSSTCDLTGRRWRGEGDCYWRNPQPDWGSARQDNGVSCDSSFDCEATPQYPDCLGPQGSGVCTDTLDDPRLAKDESAAFGPEIIRLRNPIHAPGPVNRYHIGVHYFPDPSRYEPRTTTVRVFYEGQEIFAVTQPGAPLARLLENAPGTSTAFWYVGWVDVSPGDATLISSGLPTFNVFSGTWPALEEP